MKKILVYVMLACIFIGNTGVNVYAKETEDYKTFSQGDERWSGYAFAGGNTIGRSGCFITAITILMAYANPDLRDVSTFNPQVLASKMNFTSGGGLYPDSCKNGDSTFEAVAQDNASSGSFSAKEAEGKVIDFMKKGYFVTIKSSKQPITSRTHFSPVVGLDDKGKPIVWDVNGGKNSDWDTWNKAGIDQINVFKSSISKSLDVLQGGTGNGESTKSPTDEAVKEAKNSIIPEDELLGIDSVPLKENQINLITPTRDGLSISEVNQVEEIGNNIGIKTRTINYLNSACMLIGLFVLVYASLLFLGGVLDITNAWVDISVVERLTFGKCRVVTDSNDYNDNVKSGTFTMRQWRVRCIVVALIGGFLVSGVIFKVIYWIMRRFLI